MFCSNCGKEISNQAVVCPNCGAPTQNYNARQEPPTVIINNTNTNANVNTIAGGYGYMVSTRSRGVALLLSILLGYLGIHRFYVGKIGTGILYLFTGGLFGIGWIVDIILIAIGSFRDNLGLPLR